MKHALYFIDFLFCIQIFERILGRGVKKRGKEKKEKMKGERESVCV